MNTSTGGSPSFQRSWAAIALLVGGTFMGLGVLQSPVIPLLVVVLGVAGPVAAVRAREPITSARGRAEYVDAAALTSAAVLALVGVAHHLQLGLTLTALLVATSPPALRAMSTLVQSRLGLRRVGPGADTGLTTQP